MDDLPVFLNTAQAARRLALTGTRAVQFLVERGYLAPAALDADGHPLFAPADVEGLAALRVANPPQMGWPKGRPRTRKQAMPCSD